MTFVWSKTHLTHLVDDSSMNWLEAITGIRKRASVNDRVRVLQKRVLHFSRQINIDDAFFWIDF